MAVREAVILSRTRSEAGNPKEDEIADIEIKQFLEDCLDKISQFVHNWDIYSVTAVKNQQDYAVSTGVVDVLFCDWQGATTLGDIFGSDFDVILPGITPGYPSYSASGYDVETGIYKEFVDALTKKTVQDKHDWNFRVQDSKLFLTPPPSTAGGKIYYIGVKRWTIDTLPDKYEKLVVWYCTAEALELIARKKRRLSAISHSGALQPWSQADPVLQDALRLRKRFDDALIAESKNNIFP